MKSILCAAALAAVVASPCLAQPAVQWKLATGYRAESFHTQNIEAFRDDLGLMHPGRTVMGNGRTVLSGPTDDVTRIAPPTMTRQPGNAGTGTQMRGPAPQTLLPQQPTFDAWFKAWDTACTGRDCNGLKPGFWNSVKISALSVPISILIAKSS